MRGQALTPFSILERAAIDELDETTAELSRLERLLIAAIVEIGRLNGGGAVADELPSFPQLTRRENEVLRLIVEGRTNKTAAMALGISARTVEVHRLHIIRKLGARSSSELIRIVAEATIPARAA